MDKLKLNKYINININEFLLAIIICANSLNWIFKIGNGLAIYVIASFFILLSINFKRFITTLTVYPILFIIYIYIFFITSRISINHTELLYTYLQQFTVLGAIPILVSTLTFNTEKVLRYIFLIGLLFLPFIFSFDSYTYDLIREVDGGGGIMGLSYGFLIYCTAILITLFIYKKQSNILRISLFIVLLSILYFIFSYGSRGPIVALILLICVLFVVGKNSKNGFIRNLFFVSLFLALFLLFFVWKIYPMLETYGINFRFIGKFSYLSEDGDISNGRNVLYKYALDSILDKPIIGHSIGGFNHPIANYPHNLFLHFLYEGGLLLGIPIIYLVAKSIFIMFSKVYNYNFRILVIFLFFSSIVGLMFSSYPWISQIFWLLIGNVLNRKNHVISKRTLDS